MYQSTCTCIAKSLTQPLTVSSAEVGATTSLFPFSPRHVPYLNATHRSNVAVQAEKIASTSSQINILRADEGAIYDELITINLSTLEPHINGPNTPDLATPLSLFSKAVKTNQWPEKVSAGLIGSCTNSSYQDMTRAENLVKQASAAGLKPAIDFFVTPGSEQIRATLERDSTLSTLEGAGATILANACGVSAFFFDLSSFAWLPSFLSVIYSSCVISKAVELRSLRTFNS